MTNWHYGTHEKINTVNLVHAFSQLFFQPILMFQIKNKIVLQINVLEKKYLIKVVQHIWTEVLNAFDAHHTQTRHCTHKSTKNHQRPKCCDNVHLIYVAHRTIFQFFFVRFHLLVNSWLFIFHLFGSPNSKFITPKSIRWLHTHIYYQFHKVIMII